MPLSSALDVQQYVEQELDRTIRRRPGWSAHLRGDDWPERIPDVPNPPATDLWWRIECDTERGWYRLDARLDLREFLIWFGHQRVGVGVHWAMRPAIHVAFEHLGHTDVFPDQHLGDVLDFMLHAHKHERHFPMNDVSLT